jgi:hypothetical protein
MPGARLGVARFLDTFKTQIANYSLQQLFFSLT